MYEIYLFVMGLVLLGVGALLMVVTFLLYVSWRKRMEWEQMAELFYNNKKKGQP